MDNADEESDIDLMIITQRGTLWTTRLISLLTLRIFGFDVRRFGQKNEKDKLCLNIWLDETSLSWDKKRRNVYTAHEIAQAKPLVNKEGAFDKFLKTNSWVKEYWPNAIQIKKDIKKSKIKKSAFSIFESFAKKAQLRYMRGKRTKETVTSKKALFHPVDWSELILTKLSNT
jgi:D-beta-D-heptose 7-phosphate kinase/D-beta-D-heptose 1-phosphate adenosyltransferase